MERRLLRRDDRGGVQRLELTHDLLTGVVRASRDRRHQREKAEKDRVALLEEQQRELQLLEEQREEENRERSKRDLRRTRKVAVIFALLTIATVAGLIGAIHSRSEMQKASAKEQEARKEAERQAGYADSQRMIAEKAVNRIQQSLLIRQAALSGDQEKLNDLLSKLGQNDNLQFRAVASDLHYKSSGYDIYKFELFPRRDTLPSGKDTVAFITYLADHPTFQNILLTAGQKREFRATYTGWGCLHRIVALTEYADPTKSPTVTVIDMCKLLGDGWYRGP